MKAVNLIPADQRRAGAGGPGRSGAGVYVVLGVLGVLVAAVAVMVFTTNSINARKAEVVKLTAQAASVEAQANALKPYRDFATLREKRLSTVATLATSRFDWERTMSQLARVLPPSVSLTALRGSVAPGIAASAGGGGGQSLRPSINAPAIDLVGCTSTQTEVSRVMSRLRRMTDVTKVALAASEKADQNAAGAAASGGAPAAAGSEDCAETDRPKFTITVFFQPLAGAPSAPGAVAAPAAAPAGAAAPASNAPAPATP